jgi:hypothetical protein
MPGRTLDQIIMETLGLKEMTIARLVWQVEDLKAQVEALKAIVPASSHDEGKSDE